MFLKIENPGVCPVEGFTVLGLSSARGNADKIGQFGSGAKHGVLTCLRNNIIPQIFLGRDKLEFATEKADMAGKEYNRVLYSFRNQVERTSMALEFGAMDWAAIDMGLREFVSNALDSVQNPNDIRVEICDKVEAADNTTRVYLPLTSHVNKFFSDLHNKFLQLRPNFDLKTTLIRNNEEQNGRFYRKGVFVRECRQKSLFHYNFGDNVKINESRDMDDYVVQFHAAVMLRGASVADLQYFFGKFDKFNDIFECKLDGYYFASMTENQRLNWSQAFVNTFGPNCYIAEKSHSMLITMAEKKGKRVIIVPTNGIFKALEAAGIKTIAAALENVDGEGRQFKNAPPSLIARVMKIWNKLENNSLTNGRSLPAIRMFRKIMNAGEVTGGYYKDGTIYINEEHVANKQTILEELAHHITGATDNSRDFQDYAFKVATVFMK